jgi:iron-sulfur cluster repair protein YtfE (RIC family)
MMWAALHGLDFLAGLDGSRDHVGLLVVTVGELVARGADTPKPVVERAVVELRDALFEHLAKEEEGLFPYVVTYAPGLAKSVARLSTSHEALSAAVLRLEQSVHRKSSARRSTDTPSAAFDRFHAIYTDHEASETRFLRRVDARLDDAQRHALAAIVRGL